MKWVAASLIGVLFLQRTGECQPTGHILFSAFVDNNDDIYSVNPDGTNLVRLTDDPHSDVWPRCSPDGKKIVFVSDRDRPTNEYSTAVFVMNADGTNPTRLTPVTQRAFAPAWSPDGTKIAYMDGYFGDIIIMNADGSNPSSLTKLHQGSSNLLPTWSPDGKKVAFFTNYWGPDVRSIAVVDIDGANWIQLIGYSIPQSLWHESGFKGCAWSPDGGKIAYVYDYDIWVINADGTEPINLTNSTDKFEEYPTWLPDGSQIMFGSGEIQIMNHDGTGVRTLIAVQGAGTPCWCPFSGSTVIGQSTWGMMKHR